MRCASAALSTLAAGSDRRMAEGVLDLGNVRPEGIHILPEGALEQQLGEGTFALVSELLYGGVVAVNVDTGAIARVVNQTAYFARPAIGIWFVPENE